MEVDDYIGVQEGVQGVLGGGRAVMGQECKGSEVNSSKSIVRWMEGWEAGQSRLQGLEGWGWGGGGGDARRWRRLEGVSGASAWAEGLHA